jgi:hypothetical protein
MRKPVCTERSFLIISSSLVNSLAEQRGNGFALPTLR